MVRTRDFDGGAAADDEASVVANQTLVVALIASHQWRQRKRTVRPAAEVPTWICYWDIVLEPADYQVAVSAGRRAV